MKLIYDSRNKILYSEIPSKFGNKSWSVVVKIHQAHAAMMGQLSTEFKNTKKCKQHVVDLFNRMSCYILNNYTVPREWNHDKPLENVPEYEDEVVESTLGEYLLTVDGIAWDVDDHSVIEAVLEKVDMSEPADSSSSVVVSSVAESAEPISIDTSVTNSVYSLNDLANTVKKTAEETTMVAKQKKKKKSATLVEIETPKTDLYIQPPKIPQFDYTKPWLQQQDGADLLTIYTSLPEIPTKQCDISVTTDVTKMTDSEKLHLYPNHVIHTRAPIMYEECPGIELHPKFGLIIPVDGFTREQILDNIIRYPHFYRLNRLIDNQVQSFYSSIEIDSELVSILDVWDDLPEAKIIPKKNEFVKEYVVRRYLLERDILHIEHKYPMFGTLDEFLTLFMPVDDYIAEGYTNVVDIATKCINSRVSYKRSRNPIIRRLKLHNAELHI